ncbi:hypothetical protein OIU83_06500 [Flavobacterium sp. LS1R49]|uniref:Uncharacterized protein n=1 Tax=Flavobacterium shii TaxID=2987687 RepID=A0A9X2ZAK6_9FLAO|nr:hypothetical protein [Flavobacterium shii]MCV9927294.1 hypothetical protein [Flavobacterium shii]
MYTKILLIQEVLENDKPDFRLIKSDYFQWTFEHRRTKSNDDPDYFPFLIFGENLNVMRQNPGAETKIFKNKNELTFIDNYCVPAGFTIAVLFPKNYIPKALKFKDKSIIPVNYQGQFVAKAPGQFEIAYNFLEKRCAIIFNIHENVCFGFKCKTIKVEDEDFPRTENTYADEFFEVSIDAELLKVEVIRNEDLLIINEVLNTTDLEDLKNSINEVLISLKDGNKPKAKSAFDRFTKYVLNGTSLTGNLTKIIDSYNEGGTPQKFVASLLEHINW